jgi:ABC-type Na+ efflux pump permease subunit
VLPDWASKFGLTLACVFALIGFGVLIILGGRFLWLTTTNLLAKPSQSKRPVSSEESVTVAYILSILFYYCALLFILFSTMFDQYTGSTLLFNNIALTVMCILPISLPGRFARSKVAQTERLLELKQHFVRYIRYARVMWICVCSYMH